MKNKFFWKQIPLDQMTTKQWESLCDRCGKCCVLKLEDIDTGEVLYTNVGCKLLNCKTARCNDYQNRQKRVPDCIILSMKNLSALRWMPKSCAYRLLFEGKDLPEWHPLVTGTPNSTKMAGQSVAGQIFSEKFINEDELPNHITSW